MEMNAIILAAGMGSRFKEITKKTHKALLPIGGIPNIERTINYLNEFGITNICIVTGYLHQQFDFLSDKYDCKLIYNDKFSDYNNIYSFFLAKEKLNNSFVIDADVVLLENIFQKSSFSHYYTILREESEEKEWIPILNGNGFVESMEISSRQLPSMLGISFWNKQDGDLIKEELNKNVSPEILENPKLYWDNIPISILPEINVKTIQINSSRAGEIDNLDNYLKICKQLK